MKRPKYISIAILDALLLIIFLVMGYYAAFEIDGDFTYLIFTYLVANSVISALIYKKHDDFRTLSILLLRIVLPACLILFVAVVFIIRSFK